MSVLFITDRWPLPVAEFRHGTAIRMRMLLQALQQVDSQLFMLLLSPVPQEWDAAVAGTVQADLQRLWGVTLAGVAAVAPASPPQVKGPQWWKEYVRPALGLYQQPNYAQVTTTLHQQALHDALARWRPQVLFAHRLQAMSLLRRADIPTLPVLFDLDDIEHKTFERIVLQPPHWRSKRLYLAQTPALRRMESWAIRRARTTLVCSDTDGQELRQAHPGARIGVVPNTVPSPPLAALPEAKSALFLGIYGYDPNRIAADLLVNEVWPIVRRQHPDARLLIAGKRCELVKGHDRPPEGVEFLGFVDDLDALYARTRVVCCPILSGGGTRIKIVEAALRGRPVVSTTIGAEGLKLRADQGEICIADGVPAFAEALSNMLHDFNQCQSVGERGRLRAQALYAESSVMGLLVTELRQAIGRV